MRKIDMEELFTNELINEMYPKTSVEFWNFYAKDIESRFYQSLKRHIKNENVVAEQAKKLEDLKHLCEKYSIDMDPKPSWSNDEPTWHVSQWFSSGEYTKEEQNQIMSLRKLVARYMANKWNVSEHFEHTERLVDATDNIVNWMLDASHETQHQFKSLFEMHERIQDAWQNYLEFSSEE